MQTITIPGAATFPAEVYVPASSSPAGLVVIAYGSDGFVDNQHGPWQTMIRDYADDLASRGLFVVIPDYFASTGSPHGGAAVSEIVEKRWHWATALAETADHARSLPGVDRHRIGMLGFSLGGYLALISRAAAQPKALVEFFAPRFDGIGAQGSVHDAQIHHGTLDHGPTAFANAAAIAADLRREMTTVEIFEYEGATHGFATTTDADRKAAAASKVATVRFFENML